MTRKYSDLWYSNLMGEGEPARMFSSTARVWSEMAVKTIIVRALQDDATRREEDEHNRAIESPADYEK